MVWDEAMAGRRILIISEYIAPVRAVASIRWSSFAKYLSRDFDCDVTVLTNLKSFDGGDLTRKPYQYDSSLEDDLRSFSTVFIPQSVSQICSNVVFNLGYRQLERMRRSASTASGGNGGGASSKSRSVLASSLPERVFELVDGCCCKAFAAAGLRANVDFSSFDVVISTYGPAWPHRLAKMVKERFPDIRWIADFRDPIVRSRRTDTPRRRALAGRMTEGADCVTTVSRGFVDCLHLPESRRVEVLDNGFDPSSVARTHSVSSDPQVSFRLVYTGTLYSDDTSRQDMSPLLRSLERLIDTGIVDEGDVSVEYAGRNSDLFVSMCARFPRVRSVDHGLLSRDEAMTLQARASALIVCAWNTDDQKGVLTAKIYEYMQQSAPIIGLCCGEVPNSDLRALIESSHLGMCHEEADPSTDAELDWYLTGLYRQWKADGRTSRDPRSAQGVLSYSYPVLAKRLVDLIEGLGWDSWEGHVRDGSHL